MFVNLRRALSGSLLACVSLLFAAHANAQTVFNVTDATSLSNAIDAVNTSGGSGAPYTINITQSIALSSPLAPILNSVTINGGPGITVSGGNATRIFMVGVDSATQNSAAVAGSVIANATVVAINNLNLSQGLAQGGSGGNGAGGGLGAGGALFVNQSGQVTLTGVSFSANKAQGGTGVLNGA